MCRVKTYSLVLEINKTNFWAFLLKKKREKSKHSCTITRRDGSWEDIFDSIFHELSPQLVVIVYYAIFSIELFFLALMLKPGVSFSFITIYLAVVFFSLALRETLFFFS